ncbi:unnamed protein product [Closterium sp. Yama58-4]|nr:unnamed protein product [Closterium sp. Yama58-4]
MSRGINLFPLPPRPRFPALNILEATKISINRVPLPLLPFPLPPLTLPPRRPRSARFTGSSRPEPGAFRAAGAGAGGGAADAYTWQTVDSGVAGSLEYRMRFKDRLGRTCSPWHHIPLNTRNGHVHVVCTTPKKSWARFEVAADEDFSPLRLARKSLGEGAGIGGAEGAWGGGSGAGIGGGAEGAGGVSSAVVPLHYASNCPWNVVMLPQTFADPQLPNLDYLGLRYDGRPLEMVELGRKARKRGQVYAVKVVSAFALVDLPTMRLSWKLLGMAVSDRRARRVSDAGDVHRVMPGTLEEVREWLRQSERVRAHEREWVFGLNERAGDALLAGRLVAEAHAAWQRLMARAPPRTPAPLHTPPHTPTHSHPPPSTPPHSSTSGTSTPSHIATPPRATSSSSATPPRLYHSDSDASLQSAGTGHESVSTSAGAAANGAAGAGAGAAAGAAGGAGAGSSGSSSSSSGVEERVLPVNVIPLRDPRAKLLVRAMRRPDATESVLAFNGSDDEGEEEEEEEEEDGEESEEGEEGGEGEKGEKSKGEEGEGDGGVDGAGTSSGGRDRGSGKGKKGKGAVTVTCSRRELLRFLRSTDPRLSRPAYIAFNKGLIHMDEQEQHKEELGGDTDEGGGFPDSSAAAAAAAAGVGNVAGSGSGKSGSRGAGRVFEDATARSDGVYEEGGGPAGGSGEGSAGGAVAAQASRLDSDGALGSGGAGGIGGGGGGGDGDGRIVGKSSRRSGGGSSSSSHRSGVSSWARQLGKVEEEPEEEAAEVEQVSGGDEREEGAEGEEGEEEHVRDGDGREVGGKGGRVAKGGDGLAESRRSGGGGGVGQVCADADQVYHGATHAGTALTVWMAVVVLLMG